MIIILLFLLLFPKVIFTFTYTVNNVTYQIGDIFQLNIMKSLTENAIIQFSSDKKEYEVDLNCKVNLKNRLFKCKNYTLKTIIRFKIYPLTMTPWICQDSLQTFKYTININLTKFWLNVYNVANPFDESPFIIGEMVFISCSVKLSFIRPNLIITNKSEFAQESTYSTNYVSKVIYYSFGTCNTTITCDYNGVVIKSYALFHFDPIFNFETLVESIQKWLIISILVVFVLIIPPTVYLVISMILFNSFLKIKDYMNDTKYLLENFLQIL